MRTLKWGLAILFLTGFIVIWCGLVWLAIHANFNNR